jgi:membrane protease subunit (stomatin/prohibitin family)
MAANTQDLSRIIGEAIEPTLDEYGLSMPELYIENISLPPEVEAALDRRTSMGIVGDLNRYSQFSAAEAMRTAASTPDSGMGAGIGMGMGAGMGMGMAGQMAQNAMGGAAGPWGAAPQQQAPAAAAPPPPPPAEKVWHIAENGATKGPYGRANLGQMVTDGSFTRDTLVWTAGQDGWKKAGDITELAQLFTVAPPPPPPGV